MKPAAEIKRNFTPLAQFSWTELTRQQSCLLTALPYLWLTLFQERAFGPETATQKLVHKDGDSVWRGPHVSSLEWDAGTCPPPDHRLRAGRKRGTLV